MRIAIVSDIHANLTAFEAVLADLRKTSPDIVFHGGDLADSGASPVEIVDRIRDLGWQGVLGNTDEMLFDPESLRAFASQSPGLQHLFTAVGVMAAATREMLGQGRLEWLRGLPRSLVHGPMALTHATSDTPWRAPGPEATDAELSSVYSVPGRPVAVYGHIHRPYIRKLPGLLIANTGSVSLSYDGDRRASYLLLDGLEPEIRRVEYDVSKEVAAISGCGLPHAEWIARILESGRAQMP